MIFLRSLAFNLYFYSLTFVLSIVGIGVRIFAPARTADFARFWIRLVLRAAERICGITLELSGREHLPEGGAMLLAAQHQSAYDTLIWMLLLPRTTYVVKQELMRLPLFGPLLKGAGMIGVDRKAGSVALKQLTADAQEATRQGRQIVIFPEGTRVAPGVRVPLRPGIAALATRLDLPVIPVATDSGRHWGRRSFLRSPGPIHVAICPPLAIDAGTTPLLERIVESWITAEHSFGVPGDNSVGEQPADVANPNIATGNSLVSNSFSTRDGEEPTSHTRDQAVDELH